jgi:uncharacterized metal-binding protein YceD (DUF177 family)
MTYEQLSLKDLERNGCRDLTFQDAFTYDDLPITQPVEVQGRVQLTDTGAVINGKFKASIEEPCDRCSEPFQREFKQSFEDRFVYQSLVDWSSRECELHAEDFYDMLGPDTILDIHDLVYQHIVLAMSTDRMCNRDTCVINYEQQLD